MKFKVSQILLLVFLILSCGKSTEVTIVDDSSGILPGEGVNNSQSEKANINDGFVRIKVGELNKVQTLDPLFGTTTTEFRVYSLIYDGLTKIDPDGNLAPAIAKSWTVSRDSLRYTFTIRDNVFYHSAPRFTSGIGRMVVPEDIIFNFERMASVLVPDNAADMFSTIKGFDDFHTEQTFIKVPENRTIKSIEGLSITNDSTVVIQLAKKDGKLLEKLAHPSASVYPRESVPSNKNPITEPIGTGGYYLAQKRDNLLILASNDDYFQDQTVPTRIDITHGKKESELYQDFAKGNLDALLEIGPGTIQEVIDTTGALDFMFRSSFSLYDSGTHKEVNFYYNMRSDKSSLYSYLVSQNNSFLDFENPLGTITIEKENRQQFSDSLSNQNAYISYTDNSEEVFLADKIAEKLAASGATIVMNSSYAVTDEVTFSTIKFPGAQQTVVWSMPVYVLFKPNISGITISKYPWNISFNGVTVNQSN